jgi:hypothetical protein
MSLEYSIQVTKDHAQVTATWDLSVDLSEFIANFTLTVAGKALNTQCSGGNTACRGSDETTLDKPDQDCPVAFSITTNSSDEAHGDDTLRGDRTNDDVEFEND